MQDSYLDSIFVVYYSQTLVNIVFAFKCTNLFLIYSPKIWQIPRYTVNSDFMTWFHNSVHVFRIAEITGPIFSSHYSIRMFIQKPFKYTDLVLKNNFLFFISVENSCCLIFLWKLWHIFGIFQSSLEMYACPAHLWMFRTFWESSKNTEETFTLYKLETTRPDNILQINQVTKTQPAFIGRLRLHLHCNQEMEDGQKKEENQGAKERKNI